MNFLPATVEGDHGEAAVRHGRRSPTAKAEKAQGKGLLIAGIRPEHFEDAAVMDRQPRRQGSTFRATVDVVEWLGNEAYAYIPFEAPAEVQEQLHQLERDLDGEALRTQLVDLPRRRQPDQGGRRGGDLGRRLARCTCSTRPPARTSPSTRRRPARSRATPRPSEVADEQDAIATPGEQEAATET